MSDRLAQGFGFTPEELAVNRQGRLSPAQAERVAAFARLHRRASRVALIVFGLMALGALVFALTASMPGIDKARPVLLGFAAGLAGLFALVLAKVHSQGRDLAAGRVSRIEGPVRLREKEVGSPERKLGTAYLVTVGGRTFQLESPEQFAALEEGRGYRFFVVRNGRVPIVLSVESV